MTPCRRFTPAITTPWNSWGATISTDMTGSRMVLLAFSIAEEGWGGGGNGTSVNMTLFEQPWTEDARSEAHLVWERPLLLGWRRFHWNRPCGWRRPPGRIAPPRSCGRSGVPSRRRPWSPAAGEKEKDARWWTQDSSFHVVALTGAGETNLFNGWYKLLGDVGSNGLVFKLQLGVMLWLKRLKHTCDFTELARSSRLLLVSEVKPAGRRFFFILCISFL